MLKPYSRSLYPSWLALACLLFTSVLHAETAAPTIAPGRFQMLEKALQAEVDQGRLAGIAVLVEQDGKLLHRSQHGYQDIAAEVPLAEDTLYKIFSLTKPVTSVAMLMLQEQGKLSLDDPLAKYLPEFADLKVAVAHRPGGLPQTDAPTHARPLREFMHQPAGFSYGVFSQSHVDTPHLKADLLNSEQTLEAMVHKLAKLPLLNQPGTAWTYTLSAD